MEIPQEIKARLLTFQKNEITEFFIYNRLANLIHPDKNAAILREIAKDEKDHYDLWKGYTGEDVPPNQLKIIKYYWISKILGFTFGIKLMENGEGNAQKNYAELIPYIPEAEAIAKDENDHEEALLQLLDEERLKYTGSVVLGLNDALVELTGALAGLTFAFQNTQLIAISGLVTGIAASFSMASSEYLSTKAEENEKTPIKACIYTGSAYIVTVFLLIIPYFIFKNCFLSLAVTLGMALLIIAIFNFYISIAKDDNFKKRFLEMALLSMGVAGLSFIAGLGIRHFLGVDL